MRLTRDKERLRQCGIVIKGGRACIVIFKERVLLYDDDVEKARHHRTDQAAYVRNFPSDSQPSPSPAGVTTRSQSRATPSTPGASPMERGRQLDTHFDRPLTSAMRAGASALDSTPSPTPRHSPTEQLTPPSETEGSPTPVRSRFLSQPTERGHCELTRHGGRGPDREQSKRKRSAVPRYGMLYT